MPPVEPPAAPSPTFALEVLTLTWERVLLTIRVAVTPMPDATAGDYGSLAFALVDSTRDFPITATEAESGIFDLTMNVTTFSDRREIPNGTWRIRATSEDGVGAIATIDSGRLASLDDASRVFLYSNNNGAYTVSYGIAESDVQLEFLMRTYQYTRAPGRISWRHPLRRAKRRLYGTAAKRRYAQWIHGFFSRVIGPRSGQILFASEQRATMEGNLLRVHERLVERGLDKKFTFRYSFRLPATSGRRSTVRLLYLLATSETILLDDYFSILSVIDVHERTTVIQLWHAGSGFKSVGFSRFGQAGSPMLRNSHRYYTYAITGSQHLVPVYAEAFGIEPESVIPTGLPRVDWFLDAERANAFTEDFYGEYPELVGKRIILFAPTFRGRSITTAYYDYSLIDFDALYQTCGPDTVVLFRMHHFVASKVPIPTQYADRFFDFSHYPKGLELLHVTDVLITDYSSIIYEYSLLDRPMLFFAPDKVNYAATRGFHRDFDETAPGRVCETFDEVLEALANQDYDIDKVARFRDENFDIVDTGAADRVIDQLILSHPLNTPQHPKVNGGEDGPRGDEDEQEDEGL